MDEDGLPLLSDMASLFKTMTALMTNKMSKKSEDGDSSNPVLRILKDCETFCSSLARKIATIKDEYARKMLQLQIHNLYIKFKHNPTPTLAMRENYAD